MSETQAGTPPLYLWDAHLSFATWPACPNPKTLASLIAIFSFVLPDKETKEFMIALCRLCKRECRAKRSCSHRHASACAVHKYVQNTIQRWRARYVILSPTNSYCLPIDKHQRNIAKRYWKLNCLQYDIFMSLKERFVFSFFFFLSCSFALF